MKSLVHAAATATEQQRIRNAGESVPRQRRARPDGVEQASRGQRKKGAYKRVELWLGMEAVIALRQLMRDGRSAREVIEALLLEAKRRRRDVAAAEIRGPP